MDQEHVSDEALAPPEAQDGPAPAGKRTGPRRRRFLAPLLALLAAACMALVLVRANQHNIDPYVGESVSVDLTPPPGSYSATSHRVSALGNLVLDLKGFSYGWPFRYREYWTLSMAYAPSQAPASVQRESVLESPGSLWANAAVGLAMVLAVAGVAARQLRGRRWLQFGLREALVATAAVAVGLSVWRTRAALETAFGQEHLVSRVFELPLWLCAPILAGLAVTLFAAIWLLLAALTWPLVRLARRGHEAEALASRIS